MADSPEELLIPVKLIRAGLLTSYIITPVIPIVT